MGVEMSSWRMFGNRSLGRWGRREGLWRLLGASPHPHSPLRNRLVFGVVWCCPVLFGHTPNQRTLLTICCPSRDWHCLNRCSFGVGVLSSSLLFPPLSVRLKLGSGFLHTGHGWFLPCGGHVVCFIFWRCFSLKFRSTSAG